MTAIGYVLITTVAGEDQKVYQRLLKVPEIVELMPLFGHYDLIAKLNVPDALDLPNLVRQRIGTTAGVTSTKLLAANSREGLHGLA